MSDNPPPKKKSRFFSNGKSVVDNLLHPLKKKARKDGVGSEEADGDETPRSGAGSTDEGPPLLANIHPLPPLTVLGHATTSAGIQTQRTPASNSASFSVGSTSSSFLQHQRPQSTRQAQTQRQEPPAQPRSSDSEAETEVETDVERSEDEEDYDASDEENARPTTARGQPNVRSQRRNAIYGADALLPSGSNTNGHQVAQPPSTSYPYPLPYPAAQTTIPAALPTVPDNAYTFSGVPTNPYATVAGGQYPFNFRPNQDLSIPVSVQQQAYTTYVHPLGSGLARMAQQSLHSDTGPLSQGASQPLTTPNRPIIASTPAAPYVDMDRDEHGRRLRTYIPRPAAHHGIRKPTPNLPRPQTNAESLVPENLYTSPNRIAHAQDYARKSLKRKRPDTILPPPSYVYQHTGSPTFNIFDGLLLYPELCFALAAHLPVKDLISLYAISKDFHVILDTRFTTVMLSQATRKAPESARTYMFRSYAHLCRSDPAARIPHTNAREAAEGKPRRIPSFRWLKMVLHREKVIHEIMAVFAEDGIPLPARCSLALKRIWFMLDIPDNARRIGFIHNRNLITDIDLYFLACFFTKMDMRLNDPICGEKRDGMRKLLLAQRSFTTVLRVLKREIWTTRFDILREWVRLKHEVVEEDEIGLDMFGVPFEVIGRGRLEYWGLRSEEDAGRKLHSLLRPDQLVVREAFKRGIRFDKHYLRFLLYGYIRPDTLENYEPRTYGRRITAIKDDEYEVDDIVGGVAALGVDEPGCDPLLDLGQPREVSRFTIVKEPTSKGEMKMRIRDEEFLDKCIAWWTKERQELREAEA
ncbi:hypothetical protein H2200_013295 [Cladophialophora chaetospira]|uniref:F-box domain-containing protein n=1 Tax=Cladophialophora chaetospira TaxID=386627 RepID=A0AA38WW10_9EURO|nr:hypothetical protein H2200_013295 [Cladophialophora chaetospira]